MTDDTLLSMLGLDPSDAADGGPAGIAIGDGDAPAPPSDYALALDAWGVRRGRELVEPGGYLSETGITPEAAADFHGAAVEATPRLETACVDRTRSGFVRDLLADPDWQALRRLAWSDPLAAEIATAHAAKGYLALVEERKGRPEPKSPKDQLKQDMRGLTVAAGAARAARNEFQEIQDTANAFGLGGPGEVTTGQTDGKRIAQLHQRVNGSATLKRIVDQCGAMWRVRQSRRRRRAIHGQDEAAGVSQGSNLGWATPAELAMLTGAVEGLSLDARLRFAEGRMQQYDFRGTEPAGRGPVCVIVDESGSMSGNRVETAKALALTIARSAKAQRRWVALIGFAGGTDGNVLILPPGRWDDVAMVDWLLHFYNGGTTLDVPIKQLPFTYWPTLLQSGAARGKTDVLIVTDAEVQAEPDDVQAFNSWRKQEKVKVTTLVIDNPPGDLALISDTCHTVKTLSIYDENVAKTLDF